ncbi:MAG: phytoene/squalene synthase family protein [Gammaproteobacteria bacterium]
MSQLPSSQDFIYQDEILQGVSRTFALTIPQLPEQLRSVVGNAYLLCRIADTIEDEVTLSTNQKRFFTDQFINVVDGKETAKVFANKLSPLLSDKTLASERDLIKNTDRIIRITQSYNLNQKNALTTCVRIMAKGMADYQEKETLNGLLNLEALDDYCYYVAGVVGEMLAKLFCDYSDEINTNHDILMKLSVSFGQGLQMTNILKDIWDDQKRGACWLPQETFSKYGFDLSDLSSSGSGNNSPAFQQGLGELLGLARNHLENALQYTLLIPRHEKGIRKFCLWAIGMAILTLNKINKNRAFIHSAQVKISRKEVKRTIALTNLFVSNDQLLKLLFYSASRGLPTNRVHG